MGKAVLLAAPVLLAAGGALLMVSVLRGEGAAGVALIVPFFYGTGPLASLGVLCIFLGMLALLLVFSGGGRVEAGNGPSRDEPPEDAPAPTAPEGGARVRGGAVVLIGPVPVVAGSDPEAVRGIVRLSVVLLALAVAAMLVLMLL